MALFLPNIIRRRDVSYIEEWLARNFGLLQCDVCGITLEAGKESAACTKCHNYWRRKPTFHKQSTLFWRHCTKMDASPLLIQIQAICYKIQGPIQFRNWVSDGILVPLWTCLPVHLYRTVLIEDVVFSGHPCLYMSWEGENLSVVAKGLFLSCIRWSVVQFIMCPNTLFTL